VFTPAATYTDLYGNTVNVGVTQTATGSWDSIAPLITARETIDQNANGLLDRIRVTFSEPISDASVTPADFGVSGYAVTGFATGVADDGVIDLLLNELAAPDTDGTPAVTYTAGTLTDLVGNALASVGPTASVDLAGPVLVDASSDTPAIAGAVAGGAVFTLTFSEDINIVAPMDPTHFNVEPDGAAALADLDVATIAVAPGPASDQMQITLGAAGTTSGLWTQSGEIDVDTFTAVQDLAGNAVRANGVLTEVPIVGLVAPFGIISAITLDTDGDGMLDQVQVTTGQLLNDDFSALVISVAGYTVLGYTTGAVANDSVFVVLIRESGIPDSGAKPAVDVVSNTSLKDSTGTSNLVSVVPVTPTDGAAARISLTLAVAGTSRVFIEFSEAVYGQIGPNLPIQPSDFVVVGAGAVTGITPLVQLPDSGILEAFLTLATPLTPDEAVSATIAVAAGAVLDITGAATPIAPAHRISDVALGIVTPVWASDGVIDERGLSLALRNFDGQGSLEDLDITLQVTILAPTLAAAATTLYFDANVPASLAPEGLWLPVQLPGLVPTGNILARAVTPYRITGALRNFLIVETDPEMVGGNTIGFVLEVGGLPAARVSDPNDPRTVGPWLFDIAKLVEQRSDVTILNNVINPDRGEQATLRYTLERRGAVTIFVTDLAGTTVDVLFRGIQSPGEYKVTWDGRNRGNRTVARGTYFIIMRGPGIAETRKVQVVR
jgi:hypothetical protein